MTDIIQRINDALGGTTPGPWEADPKYVVGETYVWAEDGNVLVCYTNDDDDPDARLIAAAPTLLRDAAAEIDRLRAEIERLEVVDTYAEWEKALIQELRDQSKDAREAGSTEGVRFKLVPDDDPERMHRVVVGALRSAIDAHGPVERQWIGSAAKRVVAALQADGAS